MIEIVVDPFAPSQEEPLMAQRHVKQNLNPGDRVFLFGLVDKQENFNRMYEASAIVTIDSEECEEPFRKWRTVQTVLLEAEQVNDWFQGEPQQRL